jgi:hypothetical protein
MCKNAIYEYYGSIVTHIQRLTVLLTDKIYRITDKDSNTDISKMLYFLCMSDTVHDLYNYQVHK